MICKDLEDIKLVSRFLIKLRSKWQLSPIDSCIGQAIYYLLPYCLYVIYIDSHNDATFSGETLLSVGFVIWATLCVKLPFSVLKTAKKMVYISPSYQGNGFLLAITPMHNAAAINSLPYILEAGRGQ